MDKDSPAKEIDLDVTEADCLMLVFEGGKIQGNWANARVSTDLE